MILLDDYIPQIAQYLLDNYEEQLIKNNVEYILKDINDEVDNWRKFAKIFPEDFNNLKIAEFNTIFLYFLLSIYENKSEIKIKWFAADTDWTPTPKSFFDNYPDIQYTNKYELNESNFEGCQHINFKIPYVNKVKLSSDVISVSFGAINELDLVDCSNINPEKFISSPNFGDYNFDFTVCPVEEIILPKGIDTLPRFFFRLCFTLKKLSIPNTVKFIGQGCFYKCRSLKEIIYEGTMEEWNQIDKSYGWLGGETSVVKQIICTDGVVKV